MSYGLRVHFVFNPLKNRIPVHFGNKLLGVKSANLSPPKKKNGGALLKWLL